MSKLHCVDAGTTSCPCHLALTGDCLICTRLQGSDTCGCDWSGVCVYNELMQNGGKAAALRRERRAGVISRREFGAVTVLELAVDRGFAQKCSRPGSYVFVRRPGSEQYYDVPISVLSADETAGRIRLAIQREGMKTKHLLGTAENRDPEQEQKRVEKTNNSLLQIDDELVLRGWFGGGLQGVQYLRPQFLRGKKVLFVTKGVGAAPAILAMRSSGGSGAVQGDAVSRITWLADADKIGEAFLQEYGGGLPRERIALADDEQLSGLQRRMKEEQYDVVAVMTSEYYVKVIRALAGEVLPEAKLVWNNNAKLCCGEGICGACTEVDAEGRTFRLCKCQKA